MEVFDSFWIPQKPLTPTFLPLQRRDLLQELITFCMGFSSNTWTISPVLSIWTQVIIKGWNYQWNQVQPWYICFKHLEPFLKGWEFPVFFFFKYIQPYVSYAVFIPILFSLFQRESLPLNFLFKVKASTSWRRSLPLSPVTWWEYQTPRPSQRTRPKSWGGRRHFFSHD